MRAGQLRERVTIQQKVVTQNAFGEEVITWTTFATTWADVEPLTGREFIEQARREAEISYKVTIRYRTGIVPYMRISWESKTLRIEAVMPDGIKRQIMLMCSEVVSETAVV